MAAEFETQTGAETASAEERLRRLYAHPFVNLRTLARGAVPNRWDVIAFALLFGAFVLIAVGARQMAVPLARLPQEVSLDPSLLPWYALRTTLRMIAAMVASLAFSISYAYLAAKSRRAERVLVPALDILQSVPILGFLSFTYTFFLGLFPGSVLGAELASIFLIFTSQAWNMTFSIYQSLRTLPEDLVEASRSLRFSNRQRFWKLEMPFALPGLVWNMMMSMSGGWFFVVAAEAITVGNHTITLPGIGSYVAAAIAHRNIDAVVWAIATMLVVILLYDQLLFRPLVAWSERFRSDNELLEIETDSWVLRALQRSRLLGWLRGQLANYRARRRQRRRLRRTSHGHTAPRPLLAPWLFDGLWYGLIACGGAYGFWRIYDYLQESLGWGEVMHAVLLGLITLMRVMVLVGLASLVWVPIGVAIGLRPRLAAIAQPVAQFLAAFPANLFFPIAVALILRFDLNSDVWLSPLMILGTQWYILFNVVAGASQIPRDLRDAAHNLHLHGRLWWIKVILPAILPYYVTGAMTAAGGAWNASIVAELVSWGHTRLVAHGLGAYITAATEAGDYPRIVLGVAVMSLFVVALNRSLWRPLYRRAEERVGLEQE
ncbi:MAG: ABC transporter permease subunit [Gammaproteobacteria bacterium]|nr:ABC transporter permease subunit [Gammaproteobacteria bacterium]